MAEINNFVEDFMRGLQQGQQQKQAKQAEIERAEDRKLEKMLLQHKLREIAISEKAAARGLDIDNFNRVDGKKSERDYAITSGVKPNAAPAQFGGMQMPGQSFGLDATRDIPAMNIRGIEELGVGGISQTPRTMEDVMRQQAEAKLQEPFNLAPGARRFQGGQVVAENPAPERQERVVAVQTVENGRTVTKYLPESQVSGQTFAAPPRGRAGSGGGSGSGGATSGGGLVDTVMENPAIYHTLTPKTREQIAPALAARGFNQFEKSSKPNDGSVNEAAETAAEVRRIAAALRTHSGLSGVFGTISSRLPTFRQDTADAEVLLESLQGLLTLENMGKMKGVLSDSDMRILRQASTTLNAKMSEPAAKAELLRLESVMKKLDGAGLDLGTGSPNGNKIGRFEVVIK